MPLNRNTLMRIRTIDSCLRRRQRLWTLEDLRKACENALYDYEGICGISTRTIQRDIELMRGDKLGYYAPIIVKDKKYYTYEDPNYSITQLPLSKRDMEELNSAMDIIRHYGCFQSMSGQEDILARMQDQIECQEDHKQVVYLETNAKLKGLHFLGALYEHIRRKEALTVQYQSFKSRSQTTFRLSPYILKEFNNRWFLLAHSHKKKNLVTIALDRIVSISKNEQEKYVENTFFEPEKYFGEMVGVTRELDSKPEIVTIWVNSETAPYVLTKPMHSSQQLVRRNPDASIVISLNVILNLELERLILGYGRHMEVIAPRTLRNRIASAILMSATRYQEK